MVPGAQHGASSVPERRSPSLLMRRYTLVSSLGKPRSCLKLKAIRILCCTVAITSSAQSGRARTCTHATVLVSSVSYRSSCSSTWLLLARGLWTFRLRSKLTGRTMLKPSRPYLAVQLQHTALEQRLCIVHAPGNGRAFVVGHDNWRPRDGATLSRLDGVGEDYGVAIEEQVRFAFADLDSGCTCRRASVCAPMCERCNCSCMRSLDGQGHI
jgi:hypothetical protein